MATKKIDQMRELIDEVEADVRTSCVTDILVDLEDSLASGPGSEDEGTFTDLASWEAGFRAAVETIRANYC